MKFNIQELTNPLTADILARKDYSFASSGGVAPGVTVIALKPSGDILSDGDTATSAEIAAEETVTLLTLNMNFLGARKLFVMATVGPHNFLPAGPLAETTLQVWVAGVKIAEQKNPAGNLTSVFSFQGVQALTVTGATNVELKLVNGPVVLGPINATISAMEFAEL